MEFSTEDSAAGLDLLGCHEMGPKRESRATTVKKSMGGIK